MLGKEWTREYFDDYIRWLEITLLKLISSNTTYKKSNIEKELTDKNIKFDEKFVTYLLQRQKEKNMIESAFLMEAQYVDDCEMNQYYFSLLEKAGNIVVDDPDKIKGLKILLSEFLYLCGYDDAIDIQKRIISGEIDEPKNDTKKGKKTFNNITLKRKNGEKENVTIFFGTVRGETTWFTKNERKIYKKIVKAKNGEYFTGKGKDKIIINDKEIINYISADYQ